MKKYFVIILFLIRLDIQAQKVFSAQYPNQSDIKVFVVEYSNQADLKVYKVKYSNQAVNNDGLWFFYQMPIRPIKKYSLLNIRTKQM